jgi:hypothetical protein
MAEAETRIPAPAGGQARLIGRAAEVAASDDRVQAAWLSGSFAAGTADEFSDIDLHCAITAESAGWFREHWADFARRISPVVLAGPIPGVIGGYAITPEWLHLDIVLHPLDAPAGFDPRRHGPVRPLFDRIGLLAADPAAAADVPASSYFPAASVSLYFYLLGNLAVVLGRGEVVLASNGAIMRRDVGLVPVMLAENGVRKSDGNKRLNRYLTAEQHAFLESLPPVAARRDAVIEFDRRVAADLIRRGRALAAATGADWPADLEAATLAYLQRQLGADWRP